MYYDTLTGPRIAFVRNGLAAVGEQFPDAVTKAMADRDKIKAAARDYEPATRDQILAATAECFLEDRDPADDERVRHLVTSAALVGEAGLNVAPRAELRVVAAIAAYADEILAMLAGPAEKAGRDLAKAWEVLGEETDPSVIMNRGLDAVEAWTKSRKAEDLLRKVDKAWTALAYLTPFTVAPGDPVLRLADVNLATFEKAGAKARPLDIVRAGGTISLADRSTYPERARRIAEERQAREGEHNRAVSEGYRRTHGLGVSA